MHVMDCSCAPILQFFYVALDGATANRQIPDPIFGQFFTSLRKDSVANYAWIWTLFSPTVRGLDVLCTKRFVVPSVGGATRFANLRRKFSKTQKKSAVDLCQILRMITNEIVINSTRVMSIRVTISGRYALSGMGRCFCF